MKKILTAAAVMLFATLTYANTNQCFQVSRSNVFSGTTPQNTWAIFNGGPRYRYYYKEDLATLGDVRYEFTWLGRRNVIHISAATLNIDSEYPLKLSGSNISAIHTIYDANNVPYTSNALGSVTLDKNGGIFNATFNQAPAGAPSWVPKVGAKLFIEFPSAVPISCQ